MEGHAAGVEGIREIIRHSVRRGIAVLSLYAFSRENWARSDDEVGGLFMLLEKVIRNETAELVAQGAHVRLLGRMEELPPETQASLQEALDATAGGQRLQLNIAFNYSGRTELVDAARKVVARGLRPDEIDEDVMAAAMYTAGLPDRTWSFVPAATRGSPTSSSGSRPMPRSSSRQHSGPISGRPQLDEALLEFASRQRRFGR